MLSHIWMNLKDLWADASLQQHTLNLVREMQLGYFTILTPFQ